MSSSIVGSPPGSACDGTSTIVLAPFGIVVTVFTSGRVVPSGKRAPP